MSTKAAKPHNYVSYNAERLWNAIYYFVPGFKVARDANVECNLPHSLNMAANYAFSHMVGETDISRDILFVHATQVLASAMHDVNVVGHFVFTE